MAVLIIAIIFYNIRESLPLRVILQAEHESVDAAMPELGDK